MVHLLCSPAGSGEARFYSTERVHFTVVQSGRAEGKVSASLSEAPICNRHLVAGVGSVGQGSHQSPAHPASSRRVARIIQLHLMFPPQGRSNRECRGQAVSLTLSRLSALGWCTGRPFYSRDPKAQGDQGIVPRAGAGLHRAAWLQTDGKDRMDIGGTKDI